MTDTFRRSVAYGDEGQFTIHVSAESTDPASTVKPFIEPEELLDLAQTILEEMAAEDYKAKAIDSVLSEEDLRCTVAHDNVYYDVCVDYVPGDGSDMTHDDVQKVRWIMTRTVDAVWLRLQLIATLEMVKQAGGSDKVSVLPVGDVASLLQQMSPPPRRHASDIQHPLKTLVSKHSRSVVVIAGIGLLATALVRSIVGRQRKRRNKTS